MRIRIEISDDKDEEIIIRCRERDDGISLIESALEGIVKGGSDLVLYINGTEYYVSKNDILFFESCGNKIYAHTKDKMYVTAYKLFELEDIMPSYFVRISKSSMANIKYISSLQREVAGNGRISFAGSDKNTYFSRGYYKRLKDKIEEVRFSK